MECQNHATCGSYCETTEEEDAGLCEHCLSAEREREADELDAARYRWLRNALEPTDGEFFVGVDSAHHADKWGLTGDEADAAIDAAMLRHNVM
jgi:hypothetical protein